MTLTPVHLNACCHTSYDTVIPVDCIAAISTAVVTIRLAPPQYSCHTSTSYYSRSVIPVHLLQYSCHTSPFCCCYSRSVLPAHLVTATVHYVIPLQLISALVHLSPVHPITATGQLSYQSTLSQAIVHVIPVHLTIGYSTCHTSPPYHTQAVVHVIPVHLTIHRLQYISYPFTELCLSYQSILLPLQYIFHTSPSRGSYSTSFIPVHPMVTTVLVIPVHPVVTTVFLSYQTILLLQWYMSYQLTLVCWSRSSTTYGPHMGTVVTLLPLIFGTKGN